MEQTRIVMAYQSYAEMVKMAKAEGMPDGENPSDYGVDPIGDGWRGQKARSFLDAARRARSVIKHDKTPYGAAYIREQEWRDRDEYGPFEPDWFTTREWLVDDEAIEETRERY